MSTLLIQNLQSDGELKEDILKVLIPTIIEEGYSIVRTSSGVTQDQVTLVLPSIVNRVTTSPGSGIEVTSSGANGTGEVHIRLRLDTIDIKLIQVTQQHGYSGSNMFTLIQNPVVGSVEVRLNGLVQILGSDYRFDLDNTIKFDSNVELDEFDSIVISYLVSTSA